MLFVTKVSNQNEEMKNILEDFIKKYSQDFFGVDLFETKLESLTENNLYYTITDLERDRLGWTYDMSYEKTEEIDEQISLFLSNLTLKDAFIYVMKQLNVDEIKFLIVDNSCVVSIPEEFSISI